MSVWYGLSHGVDTGNGFLGRVASCLVNWQPMPQAEAPWSKDEDIKCCRLFVMAWPLRIELLDTFSETMISQEAEGVSGTVALVYLPGSGEPHAPVSQAVGRDRIVAMKQPGLPGGILPEARGCHPARAGEGRGL